ncbi:MAG: fused MFS/spermidine synthase, partial [Candidatus Electryoneaceae bacterium]|nr:fused MFS/spermidine synthase [Candidatus Electryoneaceae bacterium]
MIPTKKIISILTWIFLASGFSSLIYQVVWQRILTMHYGVGAISMTLIVSIYMFGLGLGALLGGYLAERVKNRIIFYFFVELLIGCFGAISLPLLNLLGQYTSGSSYTFAAIYMLLFLAFPTLLMGITLPLLTKIFNAYLKDFLYSVSFLYFINTLGAAFGAIFASYFIISFFGLDTGIAFAVVINLVLACLIFLIHRSQNEPSTPIIRTAAQKIDSTPIYRKAYYFVFITGFLAIGYEIIWFRIVGIFVKGSPYVFSSVLFIYLLGIAAGSFLMNRIIQKHQVDRKNLFYILQFSIGAIALVTFLGYYYLTEFTFLDVFTRTSFRNLVHPSFPAFDTLKGFLTSLYLLFDVFFWTAFFVFIPTVLMGASFPLISSIALKRPDREGATIGKIYFFNITGNVFGGLITGFFLLPIFSSEITILI